MYSHIECPIVREAVLPTIASIFENNDIIAFRDISFPSNLSDIEQLRWLIRSSLPQSNSYRCIRLADDHVLFLKRLITGSWHAILCVIPSTIAIDSPDTILIETSTFRNTITFSIHIK